MIPRQPPTWTSNSLSVALLALLLLTVVLPVLRFLVDAWPGGDASPATLRGLLADVVRAGPLARTAGITLAVCVLAAVIAIPPALLAARAGPRTRGLLLGLGCLPLALPAFATAAALAHGASALDAIYALPWLDRLGLLGGAGTLLVALALHHSPILLLSLTLALRATDRSLGDSARNLGANRLRAWRRVGLPLALPACLLGIALVALRTLEDAGTPLSLGIDDLLAPRLLVLARGSAAGEPLLGVAGLLLLSTGLVVAAAWSVLVPPAARLWPAAAVARRRPRLGRPGRLMLVPAVLVAGVVGLGPPLWLGLVASGPVAPDILPPAWLPPVSAPVPIPDPAGLLTAAPATAVTGTWGLALAAGVLTLLLGTALAVPLSRSHGINRAARPATVALFAVPGLLLALAYRDLGGAVTADRAGAAWLSLALLVSLKQVPFAATFIALRLRALWQGELQTARNLGASGLGLALGLPLRSLTGTLAGVALLAAAAAVVELSAALVLFDGREGPLALSAYRAMQLPGPAAAGAAQALLLAGPAAFALGLAYYLLRPRVHPGGPDPRRDDHVQESTDDQRCAVES